MTFQYLHRAPLKPSGEKPPLLLLLHGIGADENDLFSIATFLDDRFFVVSARAPYSLGYGGYSWFDITIESGNFQINEEQFERSRTQVLEFIDELVAEFDLDEKGIYLCGFSQGAGMGLGTALVKPDKFAGVVAMSGRAVNEMVSQEITREALKNLPVFVIHGLRDPVLPIENGRATREILSRIGVDLEYKEYDMAHEISQASLGDMSEWLRKRLDD